MKTLLTTFIAICAFTLTCSAQWTTGAVPYVYLTTTANNVGIGTTTPASKLSITDAAGDVSLAINTQGGLLGDSQYLSVNVRSLFGYDGARQAIYIGDKGPYGVAANKPIVFETNGTERLRILNTNGNVGIGTTTPGSPLEISAPSVASGASKALFLLNPSNTVGAGASIIFGGPSNAYSTGSIRGYLFNAGSGGTGKLILGSKSTGTSNDELTLYGGKVGIGTQNPDQALTVNGQVHSTSVVVTSTVPADYVFNTDYYLRPLADVKNYVDKNHHLPDVPAATDFKKDGQNLGEMNMLLLRKVEELTLYVIESSKTEKEQQARVDSLQERLEKAEQLSRRQAGQIDTLVNLLKKYKPATKIK